MAAREAARAERGPVYLEHGNPPPRERATWTHGIRHDHGCAAKTWATAPPLKTVVLTGSMVSGARKSRSPAPRTTGWMIRRYSSIRPVSTSDRANRTPPWASRYPSERSCLSRVTASARSPAAIVVSPQSADVERVREHDLGDLVHRLGERPGGAGPVAGPPRVGGGADEVRAGVAHGLDRPPEAVIGALRRRSSRCSRQVVRRSRRARRTSSGPVRPCAASFPGWMTRAARIIATDIGVFTVLTIKIVRDRVAACKTSQ